LSKAPPLEEPGSPFPPIKEYAFLSDCHTGALIASDGAIAWLCIPSFDSPSVFGSLLDREAGFFRLAPFGINHPTGVVYVPGTNVLETTWKTPNGWIVVRDALTMGPRDREDTVTPHTRPPADDDADHAVEHGAADDQQRIGKLVHGRLPPATKAARLLMLISPSATFCIRGGPVIVFTQDDALLEWR